MSFYVNGTLSMIDLPGRVASLFVLEVVKHEFFQWNQAHLILSWKKVFLRLKWTFWKQKTSQTFKDFALFQFTWHRIESAFDFSVAASMFCSQNTKVFLSVANSFGLALFPRVPWRAWRWEISRKAVEVVVISLTLPLSSEISCQNWKSGVCVNQRFSGVCLLFAPRSKSSVREH